MNQRELLKKVKWMKMKKVSIWFLAWALVPGMATVDLFAAEGILDEAGVHAMNRHTSAFEPEAAKLFLVDATPVDPGKVELVMLYSIMGSKKQWKTSGGRVERKMLPEHVFEVEATIGVFDGFDFGLTQGYSILTDKEHEYDEDAEGPHKGFGRSDLGVHARWRFYQSGDETLRVAWVPWIVIPTGRRSNRDHLGPSQGFVSLGNTLAVTKDIERWTMTGNIGYEALLAHRERRENSAGTFEVGYGVGYHIFDWLKPHVEAVYAYEFEQSGKGAKVFSMVFGVIMPLNDHLRFDAGLVQDIFGSGADQTTSGVFKIVLTT
jgi:hypothetical protein